MSESRRTLLFTPGPLNCHQSVLSAMQRDVGSREESFLETIRNIRHKLLQVAHLNAEDGYTAVPIQGSGTFGLESALSTLLGKDDKLLVLENGAYGKRILQIANRAGRDTVAYSVSPDTRHDPLKLQALLNTDPSISHIAVVHCETTTGILNPLAEIAAVVKRAGRRLMVDAMSSFGALPIDFTLLDIDCLVSSPNKCLESVPGFSFAVVKESLLADSKGNCPSLSLDLYEQWAGLESSGQFRFTPPTHSLLAFDQALDRLFEAGGVEQRGKRYEANHRSLIDGMAQMGFYPLIHPEFQSPIITAFPYPSDPAFQFDSFYQSLADAGLIIYQGKLANLDCFRIGTIGQISPLDIDRLLERIGTVLQKMNVPIPVQVT